MAMSEPITWEQIERWRAKFAHDRDAGLELNYSESWLERCLAALEAAEGMAEALEAHDICSGCERALAAYRATVAPKHD